jgi:uncharacterized Zn finger protein
MSTPFGEYGPTIRVEGGIRAQSTRGAIGESWWSKRFLAVLESFALGSRLTRGRSYARKGQVLSLQIESGLVTSTVQGSRPKPYDVRISLAALNSATWNTVEATLAEQALFSARLLAGDMPQQIEEVFAAAGASLFPTSVRQLAMRCSCPDSQVPCKHLAATFYLLAEAFDADPFQILHWRGKDKQTLLADLRARRSGGVTPDVDSSDVDDSDASDVDRAGAGKRRAAGSATSGRPSRKRKAKPAPPPRPPATVGAAAALTELDSPDLADTVDRFWVPPVPLPARPPTLDTDVDLLLRQLSAPGSTLGGAELLARLRTLYTALPTPTP